MPQHKKKIQQGVWWTCQEWKGYDGLESWFQTSSAVQREGRRAHILPNSRKRGRQSPQGVEGLHQGALRQSVCRQGLHQARFLWKPLQPRHPSRSQAQIKRGEQAYVLVGQDNAEQTIIIQSINELLKNNTQPCPFTPSLRTQFPHENLCGIGCILLFRE